MANYYESARTNYVRVKDVDAFTQWARLYGGVVSAGESENREGKVCILWEDGFNEYPTDPESGDDLGGSFFADVPAHLEPKEVLILMAAGHEKLRYITGYAAAIDSTGKMIAVNIDQIYAKAIRKFRVADVDSVEY